MGGGYQQGWGVKTYARRFMYGATCDLSTYIHTYIHTICSTARIPHTSPIHLPIYPPIHPPPLLPLSASPTHPKISTPEPRLQPNAPNAAAQSLRTGFAWQQTASPHHHCMYSNLSTPPPMRGHPNQSSPAAPAAHLIYPGNPTSSSSHPFISAVLAAYT